MAEKLITKMTKNMSQNNLTDDDYNEGNLKALSEHIEKSATETKTIYGLVVNHQGPTEVKVSKESQEKLAKIVLDL